MTGIVLGDWVPDASALPLADSQLQTIPLSLRVTSDMSIRWQLAGRLVGRLPCTSGSRLLLLLAATSAIVLQRPHGAGQELETQPAGTARVSEDMDGTCVWKTQDAGTHWLSVGKMQGPTGSVWAVSVAFGKVENAPRGISGFRSCGWSVPWWFRLVSPALGWGCRRWSGCSPLVCSCSFLLSIVFSLRRLKRIRDSPV